MPINAGIDYQRAERTFQEAPSIREKIKALEEMLRTAPSHKGAENLRANIKSRLAKYKALSEKEKKGGRQPVSIRKEGAAQIVLCGFPNCGKSFLLSKITNATPIVAPYPFSTIKPEVGVLEYEGVKIQVVEIPSFIKDFVFKVQGRLYFSIIRNADLVVLVVKNQKELSLLRREFEIANVHLDQKRPDVKVTKTSGGGLQFFGPIPGEAAAVRKIFLEHNIYNATVEFSHSLSLAEVSDALDESAAFLPSLVIKNNLKPFDVGDIKHSIWDKLGLIRVFTKSPRKEKDYPPVALHSHSCVQDLAEFVHKDFLKKFRFARVWGKSAKFDGVKVSLEHELSDGDVVELHLL
ncbi:50S ribosome-binding GTPase [Candidatus Woesearchaeota archaeon]|nr:50S ribosome-binding GTPase [Candidatus Woesearchaeota archaeon]